MPAGRLGQPSRTTPEPEAPTTREGVSRRDIRSDPNQTLAEILAAVQPTIEIRRACSIPSRTPGLPG